MEKLLAMDGEMGGIGLDFSTLSFYFEVLDGDTFEVLDSLELKVKPDNGRYVVRGGAMAINKINLAEHDKEAITYTEARGLLRVFLNKNSNGGKEKLIPLGHNVGGDIQHASINLLGSKDKWDQYVSYRVEDTGSTAGYLKRKGKMPRSVSGSLESLVAHFNVTADEDLHTAKGDTKRTVSVYKCMLAL